MTLAAHDPTALRLGTRGSALALAQSGTVADTLADRLGRPVELIVVRTQGDVDPSALAQIGGTGVFVTALRAALLAGRVDLAVHSFKDLPTVPADGVALAAVPGREDPADALCARDGLGLAQLPHGAVVGTGSPRRAAQLRRVRPDLQVRPLRGNVDTRLAHVGADLDAVVLAAAGLTRLGRTQAITERLSDEVMLPAPAQGALAVEIRSSDLDTGWAAELAALDDPAARAEVLAERAVLRVLEAGCSAPIGARATASSDRLFAKALAVDPDGSPAFAAADAGPLSEPEQLGAKLAEQLLTDGAGQLTGISAAAARRS